jgi:hypothetical protein
MSSPVPAPERRGPILQALAAAMTSAGLQRGAAFVMAAPNWDRNRTFHVTRIVNGELAILATFSERDYPNGGAPEGYPDNDGETDP